MIGVVGVNQIVAFVAACSWTHSARVNRIMRGGDARLLQCLDAPERRAALVDDGDENGERREAEEFLHCTALRQISEPTRLCFLPTRLCRLLVSVMFEENQVRCPIVCRDDDGIGLGQARMTVAIRVSKGSMSGAREDVRASRVA